MIKIRKGYGGLIRDGRKRRGGEEKKIVIESGLLDGQPVKIGWCPVCGARPFEPFKRGEVQRARRGLFGMWRERDYCALICSECEAVAGYESPPEMTYPL
jgi:hypothetical protein